MAPRPKTASVFYEYENATRIILWNYMKAQVNYKGTTILRLRDLKGFEIGNYMLPKVHYGGTTATTTRLKN